MEHLDPHTALVQVLSRAERSVTRRLTEIVEAHGSTVEQWRILTLLSDGQGHPMGELAEFAFVPSPTLTRIVDRMVNDNLVYRRIDADDRRRVLIVASTRGRKLYLKLQRALRGQLIPVLTADATEVSRLTDLLDTLAATRPE